jgi:hypothetical protein
MAEEKSEVEEFIPQTLSASPPPLRTSSPLLKSMESEDGVGEEGIEEETSPVTSIASVPSVSSLSTAISLASTSSPSPLSASASSTSASPPSLSSSSPPSLSSSSPGSGEFRRRPEGGGSRIGGDRATTRIRELLALTAVQDLVYLPSFSEETLMDTLKGRYHQGYIYVCLPYPLHSIPLLLPPSHLHPIPFFRPSLVPSC